MAAEIVFLDRVNALTTLDQAAECLRSLRYVERLTHDARDDRGRAIYAEIRAAIGAARWVSGSLAEAMAEGEAV